MAARGRADPAVHRGRVRRRRRRRDHPGASARTTAASWPRWPRPGRPTSTGRWPPPGRPSAPGAPPRPRERGRLLLKLADAIEERADELARLESADTGHPIRDSTRLDVPRTAATFRYFGGMADKYEGSVVPVERGFLNYVVREPVGRGRPDRALELPADVHQLEDGAGPGRRQHGGAEAGRADPADLAADGRADGRGRLPARRGQHRARLRPRRRGRPGRAPGRAEGVVHRLDRGRPADRRGLGRQPQAAPAGAGRQGGQHRVRRRRCGRGGQRVGLRHLPQPGPGLHRRVAAAPGGADRRGVPGAVPGAGPEHPARRPAGRGHRDGAAHLTRAPRPGAGLCQGGPRRGRGDPVRRARPRRPGPGQGLLRGADGGQGATRRPGSTARRCSARS